MDVKINYNRDRESQLIGLNRKRNDWTLHRSFRNDADKAYNKIRNQLADKKLVAMRERLTKAAQAGDRYVMAKITAEIKDYMGEDRETGHYGL